MVRLLIIKNKLGPVGSQTQRNISSYLSHSMVISFNLLQHSSGSNLKAQSAQDNAHSESINPSEPSVFDFSMLLCPIIRNLRDPLL